MEITANNIKDILKSFKGKKKVYWNNDDFNTLRYFVSYNGFKVYDLYFEWLGVRHCRKN